MKKVCILIGCILISIPLMADQKVEVNSKSHPDSIYAGAIGAAIWGAYRHEKLAQLDQLAQAS